jgi:hypothetical protein
MISAFLDALQLYALAGLIFGAGVSVFASPGQWRRAIKAHGLQNAPPSFLAICAIVCVILLWPLILHDIILRRSW